MGFSGMWEKEIYKGAVLFGAPRAPCFPSRGKPITVKHSVQLPRADPALVQDTAPPWCLLFQTSQGCQWQQTRTKGAEQPPWAALTAGQGSHRPPKLAQGLSPMAGAVPSPIQRKPWPNPKLQLSASDEKRNIQGQVLLRIRCSRAGIRLPAEE